MCFLLLGFSRILHGKFRPKASLRPTPGVQIWLSGSPSESCSTYKHYSVLKSSSILLQPDCLPISCGRNASSAHPLCSPVQFPRSVSGTLCICKMSSPDSKNGEVKEEQSSPESFKTPVSKKKKRTQPICSTRRRTKTGCLSKYAIIAFPDLFS